MSKPVDKYRILLYDGERLMAKEFIELDKAEQVTPAELIETLADYAGGGWAISFRVARGILERMPKLAIDEASSLIKAAEVGQNKQEERHQHRAAYEYKQLANYIRAHYKL